MTVLSLPEDCPVGDDGRHCPCWYDGAECDYCGAREETE